MATFNKFYSFVEALAEKSHNLGSDTLEIALCNVAPTNANTKLADLTQISYTNLTADRTLTLTSSSQTGGLYTLKLVDKVISASGGPGATFRYVVIFNQTSTTPDADLLIGWYDYGVGGVTLADGESLTIDFNETDGVLTIE